MKRNTLILATSLVCFVGVDKAFAQNLRVLESRVSSVESRLTAIENELYTKKKTAPVAQPEVTAAKPKEESYIIRDGDSIGGIARKLGIPRQALLEANKMTEGQPIYIGESLVIPSSPAVDQGNQVGVETIHVVRPGDTLTGISRKYNTSVTLIKHANGLKSDVIGTGQHLMIPKQETGKPEVTKSSSSGSAQAVTVSSDGKYQYDNPLLDRNETYGYYGIQKGDNLFALARDFFTSMRELQRLNKLGNSTVIHPGDELIVPTSKYNSYHQNIVQN